MRKMFTTLGDRMLGRLLPGMTADAASCPGRKIGMPVGGCQYYCYHYSGDRTTKYRLCLVDNARCEFRCSDCC